jgi:hypothetical protein
MSTITTRAGKGSPLTNTEMDSNLTNLNTDKLQSGDTAASLTITSADINGGTIDGTTIGATTPSTAAFSETVISASGSTTALRVTNTGTGNSLLIEDSASTDGSPFVIDNAGLVGIGTTTPATKLTINNNTVLPSVGAPSGTGVWQVGADSVANNIIMDSFAQNSAIAVRRANGTAASPTALAADNLMFLSGARGYGATGYSTTSKASINMYASEAWSDTAQGTYIAFNTTANTTTTLAEKMRIDNAGNVGIGGTAGSTFKLDVIGNSSSAAVQLRAINNDTSGTSASSLVAQNGSGTTVLLQTYGTDAILNVSSNNPLAFRTNNTERMRIDTSGVVTIAGDLAVNGSTSADITTTTTTASLFNATATTVNIGSAATTISIGDTLHSGTTTVQHDLYVHGNITFGAGASTLSATTISIDDTLISLADANTADILDIGFYAGYQPASTALHTGLVRDASDSVWKLFSGISAQPTTTVDFTGATYAPLRIGALTATDGTFSGVITASAGTVSLPAITTTGDTNTGIFFPAADTIAFAEGGAEAMRIDSSGNVGIGTTSPATKLQIENSGDTIITSKCVSGSNGASLVNLIGSDNSTFSAYNAIKSSNNNGTQQWYIGGNGVANTITFQTNGTNERMRIDSSGNVGIGTASPAVKLHVSAGATDEVARFESLNNPYISLYDTGVRQAYFYSDSSVIRLYSENSKPLYLYSAGAQELSLGTNATERMRIDATGNVLVAQASRGTVVTDNDLSFDMNVASNFKCTPAALGTLTFTNITSGQSGFILLVNSGGFAISAAATTEVSAAALATISTAGTYLLSYFTDGTLVYVTNSGALA